MAPLTNNTRWFLLLVFTVAASLLALLFDLYPLSWPQIVADAVISSSALCLTVFVGVITVRAYPTRAGLLVYALLIGMVCGLGSWYLDMVGLKWWHAADGYFLGWLTATKPVRLVVALLANTWLVTLAAVNHRSSVLEASFKNISDAASLHREAELFKLRQQLQPHFLYNSLNSINALILIQPDKAQEMIGKLSDFLRNSVKREAREQIPVEEELQYIEAYLAIEAVRFGDRLQVVYDKHYTGNSVIPPFLLQPILENAIKFGLYGRTGDVSIRMHISSQSHFLVITITNPFDAGNRPPSGTGFGLEGIRRRLYLLYARTDLLETAQDGSLFTTVLKIPQGDV